MFFGGGNLVFPLWVGIETSSPLYSITGFILSSVVLPFLGILIGIYFKGDYQKCLGVWGKKTAQVLIFALVFFWIPLGSAPRCNLLAYGAFSEMIGGFPLWLYSLLYSVFVYVLTLRRGQILEILGKVVTPLLIFFLFFLIYAVFSQPMNRSLLGDMAYSDFYSSVEKGYSTMDFIAAIFFSSTIITLLKEKQGERFRMSFVRSACLIAVALLSLVYIGMFTIGCMKADALQGISGAQLLITVGHVMFGDKFQLVIFMIITLSVLSTSMALALVFSDYLNITVFKGKLGHKKALFISVFISFVLSTIGFEKLSYFISYAMSVLYPILLITTIVAFTKHRFGKESTVLPSPR